MTRVESHGCKQARGPQKRVPDGVAHLNRSPGKGLDPPQRRRAVDACLALPAGSRVLDAEVAWQKGFAKVPNRIKKGRVECPDLTSETFNQRGFRVSLCAGFRVRIREDGFAESGVVRTKPVLARASLYFTRL